MNNSKQTAPTLQEILDRMKVLLQDIDAFLIARSKQKDHHNTTDSQ